MYYKIEQLKNILASHKNCVFSLDKLCESALEYIEHLETDVNRCYELAKECYELAKEVEAKRESAQPKWISVEERLPKGEVLAANFSEGTFGYKECILGYICTNEIASLGEKFVEYFATNAYETLYGVTHWMPLPELPK